MAFVSLQLTKDRNQSLVNSNETKTITQNLFLTDFVYDETNKTKYNDTRETKKIFSKIKRNDFSIFRRRRRRRHLKGIHSRSDTNRTGAEGLSFYYPRLLYCLNQMLAVVLLSQHRVSSSKTVRSRAPCGARCIGHAVRIWSAVYSEAPHSQFGEGARSHLCMDEWNRPTPVRRRLSLTQAARGKPIPTGAVPVLGTKTWSLEAFSQYSVFHLWLVHSEARMPNLARLSKRFRAPGTNRRLDLSLTWRLSEDPLKRPYKI